MQNVMVTLSTLQALPEYNPAAFARFHTAGSWILMLTATLRSDCNDILTGENIRRLPVSSWEHGAVIRGGYRGQ